MLSAGEGADEQVVRVFEGEEVSSAWRDDCELDASELDPEKNEGVTFLWKRKFMEGNPRRVLGFWAGVEGVEVEWIMTRGGDEGGRGRLSSILIYRSRNKSGCDHDGEKQRRRNHERVSSTRHPDGLAGARLPETSKIKYK